MKLGLTTRMLLHLAQAMKDGQEANICIGMDENHSRWLFDRFLIIMEEIGIEVIKSPGKVHRKDNIFCQVIFISALDKFVLERGVVNGHCVFVDHAVDDPEIRGRENYRLSENVDRLFERIPIDHLTVHDISCRLPIDS